MLSLHVKGWVVLSHSKGWVVIAHVKGWVVLPNAKGRVVLRTTLSLTWDDNPPIFHGVNVTTYVIGGGGGGWGLKLWCGMR